MRTIISILLIIAAVVVFYTGAGPMYQEIKLQRAMVADYNIALENSAQLRQKRSELVSKYNALNPADIERVNKLLPDGVDNIRLILDINTLASKYGVGLKSIKISQGDNGTAPPGESKSPIASIQLSFSITTSYPNFSQFLKDLEQTLRIVDITSITFTSSDKEDNNKYNIILQTYWLK